MLTKQALKSNKRVLPTTQFPTTETSLVFSCFVFFQMYVLYIIYIFFKRNHVYVLFKKLEKTNGNIQYKLYMLHLAFLNNIYCIMSVHTGCLVHPNAYIAFHCIHEP